MDLDRLRDRKSLLDDDFLTRGVRSGRSTSPIRRHTEHSSYDYYDASREANLKSQIYDLESKIASREGRISELERDIRNYQDMEGQFSKMKKQMGEKMEAMEREMEEHSAIRSKAELTISTLQSDNRQLQDRVLELENRLRRQMDERDQTGHTAVHIERNYDELKQLLAKAMSSDGYVDTRSHEGFMRRTKEFVAEHLDMKDQLRKMEDNLKLAIEEAARNKDSVRKLLDDADRTKKYVSSTDELKRERDEAVKKAEMIKEEMKRLEEQFMAARQAWENSQYELRQRQAQIGEVDTIARKHETVAVVTAQEFKSFKDTLAALLSDGYLPLAPNEDSIKEKVRQLMQNRQDVGKVSKQLEEKLMEVSEQLEEQAQLHKNAIQRARKAEDIVDSYREKLKGAEGELVATDILKDGLRMDKAKYLKFLEQLADVMKMDAIVKDLGVELNGDALLARAEQLIKLEEQTYGKKNTQVMGLSKQLRDTKKELETREIQMDIMKKKLITLDNGSHTKAEHDWEDLIDKNAKLSRQVDRLNKQLNEAKHAIHSFQKENMDTDSLKLSHGEQKRLVYDLESKLRDLEQVRSKQAKKIATLKHEKDQKEIGSVHGQKVTESTLQSLSNEVQRLKRALEDAQRREKQLLDLRQVIARMLGLDVNTLAVPDYEIISRMEKLVECQHEMALAHRAKTPTSANAQDSKRGYLMEAQRRMKIRTKEPGSSSSRWK